MSDTVIDTARLDCAAKLDEIVDTLTPRPRTIERRHEIVASELKMRPLDLGARRIRSIWARDAGPKVLLDFLYRYEAWKSRVIARELFKAERNKSEIELRLRSLEKALADDHPLEDR